MARNSPAPKGVSIAPPTPRTPAGSAASCPSISPAAATYVAAILKLDNAPDIAAVRVWVKKPASNEITFRYTDQTGQTLQRSFMAADDRWTDALISISDFTGHWGGANDGIVHGPPRQIAILIGNSGLKTGGSSSTISAFSRANPHRERAWTAAAMSR